MKDKEIQRWIHLTEIAQQDDIYLLWKQNHDTFAKEFEAFANIQPENIRNFLWGYAESGRLMNQRIANLATQYMVFPAEISNTNESS